MRVRERLAVFVLREQRSAPGVTLPAGLDFTVGWVG